MQFVDMSKLPTKLRQQMVKQMGKGGAATQLSAAAPPAPEAAPDDDMIPYLAASTATMAEAAAWEEGQESTAAGAGDEEGASVNGAYEGADEEAERIEITADQILQLKEAAQAQGLDVGRLFAEALAMGAIISPETAQQAGVSLPDDSLVAQAREQIMAQLAEAEAQGEDEAARPLESSSTPSSGPNVQVAEYRDLPSDATSSQPPPASGVSRPKSTTRRRGGSRVLTKSELKEIAKRKNVKYEDLLADALDKGIELADE